MRAYGALSPIAGIPFPADSVQTLFLTGGSSGQAMDWPNSTGGAAANAGVAGANLVRFSAMSSAGAEFRAMVNLNSTFASVPASGTSVTTSTTQGSTGNAYPIFGLYGKMFQIPGYSTGWSAAALTSGYVIAEIWRK